MGSVSQVAVCLMSLLQRRNLNNLRGLAAPGLLMVAGLKILPGHIGRPKPMSARHMRRDVLKFRPVNAQGAPLDEACSVRLDAAMCRVELEFQRRRQDGSRACSRCALTAVSEGGGCGWIFSPLSSSPWATINLGSNTGHYMFLQASLTQCRVLSLIRVYCASRINLPSTLASKTMEERGSCT